jgi:hypothetical protein
MAHPWAVVWFGLMGPMLLSLIGLLSSIWAEKFDHNAAVTNFVIQPMALLSGTFYVIDNLARVSVGQPGEPVLLCDLRLPLRLSGAERHWRDQSGGAAWRAGLAASTWCWACWLYGAAVGLEAEGLTFATPIEKPPG